MSRRFPDFFDAYQVWAEDGFTPPQFNAWACLSIVAASLERKVWLPWSDTQAYYPNLYVLFVSGPGEGKTVALNKAVGLLEEANRRVSTINVLPNQATEAAFIKLLGQGRTFQIGTRIIFQNAAFYRAAEASASLRNIYGEFLACLTDLYDCPDKWSRATIKDGNPTDLKNVCVNLLAASTFDYLGDLVNDKNIMGGFASRLIYVLSRNKPVNKQRFQNGGMTDKIKAERDDYRRALVEDLLDIHKMIGPMRADAEFGAAWEQWWVDSETKRKAYSSEKLQSLFVRQNLHMLKSATLFSACESAEGVLYKRHWDKALALVEPAMNNIPTVFRESRAGQLDKSAKNIPHAILNAIMKSPGITQGSLRAGLIMGGAKARDVDSVLGSMLLSGKLSLEGQKLKILGDSDHYL